MDIYIQFDGKFANAEWDEIARLNSLEFPDVSANDYYPVGTLLLLLPKLYGVSEGSIASALHERGYTMNGLHQERREKLKNA